MARLYVIKHQCTSNQICQPPPPKLKSMIWLVPLLFIPFLLCGAWYYEAPNYQTAIVFIKFSHFQFNIIR